MKNKILIILTLLVAVAVQAQEKLNQYEYVVIPSQYEFQKSKNQYNINALLKMKFEQMGFKTYLDTDDLPKKIKTNTCKYLVPQLKRFSNFSKVTLIVKIVNCDNDILFETKEGISRSKSFKIAYNESLRDALKSFGNYRLQYEKNDMLVVMNGEPVTEKPQIVLENIETNYQLNGLDYFFKLDKDNQEIKNIVAVKTLKSVGIIRNTAKKGVFHVVFIGKKGIGYFDQKGNFTIEYLYEEHAVMKQVFEKR